MHIRAGAKGSVGFVIFKEKLFLETLDLQTSRVLDKISNTVTRVQRRDANSIGRGAPLSFNGLERYRTLCQR